jgi:thymidylate synthase (FAD)
MISNGVAKECARGILPLVSPTRLYMNATIRTWLHYIALREKSGTQREHMTIAKDIKKIFQNCIKLFITGKKMEGLK